LVEHVLEEGQARRKFRSSGSVDIQNDAYLGLQRVTGDRAITRHNYFAYVFFRIAIIRGSTATVDPTDYRTAGIDCRYLPSPIRLDRPGTHRVASATGRGQSQGNGLPIQTPITSSLPASML